MMLETKNRDRVPTFDLNDERCPKCKKHKYPFDVTCDDCYFFTMEPKNGCYGSVINALHILGYKSSGFIQKSKWADDRHMIKIECPRVDNQTLRQILNEINKG